MVKENYHKERMPLQKFARKLGVSDERARERIVANEFDFAQAVPPRTKHGKRSFEILRNGTESYFSYTPQNPKTDYDLISDKVAERLAPAFETMYAKILKEIASL